MTTEEMQNEIMRLRKENLNLKLENNALNDFRQLIDNGKAKAREAYQAHKKQLLNKGDEFGCLK